MAEKDFYQAIVEQTSVGYLYTQIIYNDLDIPIDYQLIEMNEAYESILGIQAEFWSGRRMSELYAFINKESVDWKVYHDKTFIKQIQNNLAIHFKHKNKYYRIKTHSPKKDYVIISLTDISMEIQETQKLLTLFNSVPTQVWYLKDSRTYLSANKVHADFLGFDQNELVTMDLMDIVQEKDAEVCIAGNEQVFQEKKQVVTEEWLPNSQGEKRLLRITKNPKFDSSGEIEFVICSAEDITEDYLNRQAKEIQEQILRISIEFTQELLTNKNLDQALANGLAMLGDATQVDRVYYWENYHDKESNKLATYSKIEWHLDETKQVVVESDFQDIHIEEFNDFFGPLSKNQLLSIQTKDLDEASFTKEFLEAQRIYSVLAFPIFLQNKFIGFIGFDSYDYERKWTEVEISLLNSFVLLYEKALERNQLEQQVKQKNDNFFNFFNMIEDLLIVMDRDGTLIDVNNNVLKRLDYERNELLGASYLKLHPEDEREQAKEKFKQLISKGTESFKLNVATKKGEVFQLETRNTEGLWNGKPVIFAVGKDITELVRSEDKFSKAFNHSGITMFISRLKDSEILEVNDKFLDFFGYQKDEIIGKTTSDIQITINSEDRAAFKESIKVNEKIADIEIKYLNKDQQIRIGLTNIVPVTINNEECLLTSIIDISDRVKNEQEIIELSTRDYLTDVYNRRFIYEVLEEIIEDSKREQAIFSIAILDIDNFKSINDCYGHQAGDAILKEFTRIIKQNLRSLDILGRYGGEEFIIIINHANIEKATKVIERILDNIRNTVFVHKNQEINLTFSAGVTTCREIEKDQLTIDRLIEIADQRMYRAKKTGKNKVIAKG